MRFHGSMETVSETKFGHLNIKGHVDQVNPPFHVLLGLNPKLFSPSRTFLCSEKIENFPFSNGAVSG